MENKSILRRRLRQQRDALAPTQRQRGSALICEHAAQFVWARRAHGRCGRVALYAPIGSEVDTTPLFASLRGAGVVVCYPRVVPSAGNDGGDRGRLEFADVADLSALTPGFRGIAEPRGPAAALAAIDLIFLPGLGFDRGGVRLGYGGGYYDRGLAGFAQWTAGLLFACQEVGAIEPGPHDRRVDVLVTEHGVTFTTTGLRHAGRAGFPE